MPHPTDNTPWILTRKTSLQYLCYLVCGESDNCYQIKPFALLMYSRGISPGIPSNPMTSRCPHGICLHSLILISQSAATSRPANQHPIFLVSQSAFCPLLGHAPCRLHKLQDTPFSLHSDSDKQKDDINRTQPLALSTFDFDNSATLFIRM